jgi:maltose/moltooligosaccharide transporter
MITKQKPNLTFWQLWNLSFGYIGIQLGYSLQGQSSRIFSSLGADDGALPLLWLGGPIAGLIVQPLIGLSSDKTWTKLGRRIPFLLAGGLIAIIAMIFMVNAHLASRLLPAFIFAAIMLLFMDCAFNLSMQPLRALIADMTNENQRTEGYSVQMILSNLGGILGFLLPFAVAAILGWLGWENKIIGGIPINLSWSYYIGGGILILSVLWTTFRVKEYPPKEFAEYNGISGETQKRESFFSIIKTTPKVMFQVAVVQFFTWVAWFCMWAYQTNAIAENVWGVKRIGGVIDKANENFNLAGDWIGILGAVQFVAAFLFSFIMGKLANKFGRKPIYSLALFLGFIGFSSIFFIHDKYLLFLPFILLGITTATANALPFAMISASIPPQKMGVYMGIFNISIVIPQIVFAIVGGFIFRLLVGDAGGTVTMLVASGVFMLLAAVSVVFINDKKGTATPSL